MHDGDELEFEKLESGGQINMCTTNKDSTAVKNVIGRKVKRECVNGS